MDGWMVHAFRCHRRQYTWVKWIVFSVREFIAFNVFNARARSAALIKGTCFRNTEWLKHVTESDRVDCVINSFEIGPSYFCFSRWGFFPFISEQNKIFHLEEQNEAKNRIRAGKFDAHRIEYSGRIRKVLIWFWLHTHTQNRSEPRKWIGISSTTTHRCMEYFTSDLCEHFRWFLNVCTLHRDRISSNKLHENVHWKLTTTGTYYNR